MSVDRFQLAYDGPEVHDDRMDVYDLAPALLSTGDLIRDANRLFNQDRATVQVEVESDFRHSSFDVSLLIDQSVIEHARQVLFGGSVDAKTLIEIIFGTNVTSGGLVLGAIKVYKLLRGKRPEKVTIRDESTHIYNNGIYVDAKTAILYENEVARSKMDGIVRPLGKRGIEKLVVRKNDETLETIGKENLPDRLLNIPNRESEQVLSDTREALVKVITANFEKGKWRFSDGNARFSANIEDPVFRQRLDNRDEGFYKGDVLRVRLTSIQATQPDGKLKTDYAIEEVLEHRRFGGQPGLVPPEKE